MKTNGAALCCFFAALLIGVHGTGISPVTRVVELLEGLSAKIEQETKHEEKLFAAYMCWWKSFIESRTASNLEASSRKDSLEKALGEMENGGGDVTSARSDAAADLESLKAEIESADATRDKEHKDYLSAKEEMLKTMVSLKEATSALVDTSHSDGALITLRSQLRSSPSFKATAQVSDDLAYAVEIAGKYLSKGDKRFLQLVLTGSAPVKGATNLHVVSGHSSGLKMKSGKKLSNKVGGAASHLRKKYKERSGKIKEVLKKLLSTYQGNLKNTEMKEQDAEATHEKLVGLKIEQLMTIQDTLAKLDVEKSDRAMSKSDAEEEIEALASQTEADKRNMDEVSAALEAKQLEWQDRKALRAGEVAAISKTISILRSDSARDTFSRSFQSQGYLFLQDRRALSLRRDAQSSAQTFARHAVAAAAVLSAAARTSGDMRLKTLAKRAREANLAAGHLEGVFEAIDKMIGILKQEEGEDLKNKENCEADRSEDNRQVELTTKEIEEQSDSISALEHELKQVVADIEAKDDAMKATNNALEDATRQRDKEREAFQIGSQEDAEAVLLLEGAEKVLSSFYKDNQLALLQRRQTEPSGGGAPAPPPKTWDAPYAGKKGESDGIVAILLIIRDDIKKDGAKAKEEEDQAVKEFETFQAESEEQIEALTKNVVSLTKKKGKKEEDKKTDTEELETLKGEKAAILKKLDVESSGCDYIANNFNLRAKNRLLEIDGLTKAKALLEGAAFSEGPLPKRR